MFHLRDKINRFFDDVKPASAGQGGFLEHAISDLLQYRTYNEADGLYYNAENYGFILECPVGFINEENVSEIEGAMDALLGSQTTVQFLSWTSPSLNGQLSQWAGKRGHKSELIETLARKRVSHIFGMRYGGNTAVPLVPHRKRLFVCAWNDSDPTETDKQLLLRLKGEFATVFGGKNITGELKPEALLELLGELLHVSTPEGEFVSHYSEADLINHQLPGSTIKVSSENLQFSGSPSLRAVGGTVTKLPAEWRQAFGSMLSGVPTAPQSRPIGPVLSSLTARAIPQNDAKSNVAKKLAGVMHNDGKSISKFIPDLPEKKREFEELSVRLDAGERMFSCVYSTVAYVSDELGDEDPMARLAQIYRTVGLHYASDKYLQLPVFLSCLPFGNTEKYMADFGRGMRMRQLPTDAVSTLAPVHGEYAGNGKGEGMLLIGRQGQIFNWSNYDSSGNYNTCVVGKSGAGKSVFMQDLVVSTFGENGRIVVIDDGRSFEHLCGLLGGTFVAFGAGEEIQLNPFDMIDEDRMSDPEYFSFALEMITNIIATMCSLDPNFKITRVGGLEEGFLGEAVKYAWDDKKANSTITDIYSYLEKMENSEDERVKDMLLKLRRFTKTGEYGMHFNTTSDLSIDNNLMVFEMAELRSKPVLQEVVTQMLMFLTTEMMFKSDRSQKKILMIDEAWSVLQGPSTAKFIEGVVRRARKYKGALVCGTQSLNDFFTNDAAKVIFENSDNLVTLQQKPEAFDMLDKANRIHADGGIKEQLKALAKVPGLFSEAAIYTPIGWIFGRLVLDPFNLAVFSSNGDTVEKLKAYQAEGLSLEAAVERMIERGEVL